MSLSGAANSGLKLHPIMKKCKDNGAKIILIAIIRHIELSWLGTRWECRGWWLAMGLPLGDRLKKVESKDRLLLLMLLFSFLSLISFLLMSKFSLPPSFSHLILETPSSCHLFLSVTSPSGQTSYSGSTSPYLCCPRSTVSGIWKYMDRKSINVPIN